MADRPEMHDPEEAQDAFRALFDAHCRPVLAYALRRVGEPADAADVVAETFLVAWRRRGEVPPGAAARPWLFGVARRVLANQRRGVRRRSALADRLRAQVAAQPVPDPADGAAAASAVRQALRRLDPDDREVLLLTAVEGLAPAEVAVVLGVSPVTARSRLHRARRRLNDELRVAAGGERRVAAGHVPNDGRPLVRQRKGER